jgi:Tol biopolymer transport system component
VLPPVGGTFALTESSVRTAQFAVAPDGHAIVFMATGEGGRQLWFRELGLTEPRPIAGTTGASYPFWSADSRFVGFFADRVLKKVGLTGLAPLALCDAQNGRGGAWREDGTVVFAPDTSSPLYRVDDAGGAPVPLTTLGAKHSAHRWPQFLPDGRILFFARSAEPEAQGIYVTSVDRPHEVHPVRAAATSGLYASGQLLFVLDGELMAQPLDARTLRLSSEAVPLGLKVSVSSSLNSAVSTSNQGVLATWSSAATISELVWFDARGTRLGTAGRPDRYVDFRLSPDDRRVALSRVAPATNTPDLAILNLDNEGLTAIASSSQTDASPVWSADGTRLVFRSNRFRDHDLFERPAHGGGADRFLHSTGFGMYPTDWSADGLILFHMLSKSTRHDIWALDAGNSLREVLRTAASEMQGQLAPGGRLVYTSDASGAIEVYVGALTGGKGPVNVSVNGGFDPRWRADGRELFFISAEGMLMAAEVSGDRTIRVGPARPLFQTPIHGTNPPYLSNFAVTRDGRRFLINVPAQPPGAGPITITMDWLRRVNVDVR